MAKLDQTGNYLILFGFVFLITDILWWALWIAYTARDIHRNRLSDASAGFNALASPHTAIIPSLIAIMFDIVNNCTDDICKLTTSPFTWWVFPLVVIPYDFLELYYNEKTYGGKFNWQWRLSLLGMINSFFIFFWSTSAYFVLYRRYAKRQAFEQKQFEREEELEKPETVSNVAAHMRRRDVGRDIMI